MIIKKYKFSYGGIIKKFLSKTISLLYNTLVGCFVLIILALIVSEINYLLTDLLNDRVLDILRRVEVYSGIIILGIFIIPSFLPQKVEIRGGVIRVYRHCLFLSIFMISRGFNDTILISRIEDIYIAKSKDTFLQPIPVGCIDWNNMVVIKTQLRYYYILVENSEDFIEEVNKHIMN